MPGSPLSVSTEPCPVAASPQADRRRASSASRPTSEVGRYVIRSHPAITTVAGRHYVAAPSQLLTFPISLTDPAHHRPTSRTAAAPRHALRRCAALPQPHPTAALWRPEQYAAAHRRNRTDTGSAGRGTTPGRRT